MPSPAAPDCPSPSPSPDALVDGEGPDRHRTLAAGAGPMAAERAIELLNRAGSAMAGARVAGSGTIEVFHPRLQLDEPGTRRVR